MKEFYNQNNDANVIIMGVEYIDNILNHVKDSFKEQISPYYNLPRFIYRGISKFYPYSNPDSYKNKKPAIDEVMSDFILSGLSVKLHHNSDNKKFKNDQDFPHAYIKVNYIHAIEHLLRNARKHYPERYPQSVSDLNVLADIQHNGGATCLVDFSKNILTSLWFACNDDFENDGFLYCYDIMEDMIVNDNLIFIKQQEESLPIRSLILQTYKETNISSDSNARFCLWEPSPMNNRILRQDSLFVFGIEKFSVIDHGIKVIRIPAEHKLCILRAMKGLFNISRNTIYNDYVGYASVNNKNASDYGLCNTSYNKGYFNMLIGNYDTALNYFKLWEGKHKNNLSDAEELELHFSLAICYKNIQNKEHIHIYRNNAVIEYKRVIDIAQTILKQSTCDEPSKNYYRRKCTRAYNSIMDQMYELKRYKEGIFFCDKIIHEIECGCLKNTTLQSSMKGGKELNPKYCGIVKMELLDLDILTQHPDDKERRKIFSQMQEFYAEAESYPNKSFFDSLLIQYYKIVFDVFMSNGESVEREYKHQISIWRDNIDNYQKPDKYHGYIIWNFKDIKQVIDTLDPIVFAEKKRFLQFITAYIISFRDEFEMQCWGMNDEW